MPYRRLPNTDASRLKALRVAISMSNTVSPLDLAFSQQTLLKAKAFLPLFEQGIHRQKQAFTTQVDRSKSYIDLREKAKLYISHFFQVMNFMILRNELPENTRTFYQIDLNDKTIPSLNTEQELLEWGKNLLEGDQNRQRNGGKMITNPTAAVVRVHFEKFKHAYFYQKDLQRINNSSLQKVSEMRDEADQIILKLWNEIEENYLSISDEDERREACSQYGINYVYRPAERKKLQAKKLAETRMRRLEEENRQEYENSNEGLVNTFDQSLLFFDKN